MSFNSSKLSNGLNVLTFNMPHMNSVAINVIVKVGSRHELSEESGISHFLEHMAFKGTKNRNAEQIAKEFDMIGGHFNAYTSREQTVYYAKVLPEHCATALDILADILQNSLFNQEDIDKELQVILQEIAGVNDNPDDLAFEKFYSLAYQDQPLGLSILGTHENLKKFNQSSFQAYTAKHYTTDNIFISIAGAIRHEEVVALAEKLFKSFAPASKRKTIPAKYTGGYEFTDKTLEQTTIALGFESVSYINQKDFYATQILSIIFGGGISSRLFQKIREELGLAYSISAFGHSYADSGIFSIYAATDHQHVSILIDNILSEINKVRTYISEDEMNRTLAQVKSNILMAEERTSYKSEEVGKNFALFSRHFPISEIIDAILSITTKDVLNMANVIFSSKPTLTIVGKCPADFNFNKIEKELAK
jgi:predicted Zn-dependent peptidase